MALLLRRRPVRGRPLIAGPYPSRTAREDPMLGGVTDPVATDSLLEGLNAPPARGRRARRGAAPDPRGGRLRQDPGAHPPDRAPRRHGPGSPRRDPRDHLHEQGRPGDARARRGAGRQPGPRDVGDDLPLGLRAHAARRRRASSATRAASRSTTSRTRCGSSRTASRSSTSTRSASRPRGIRRQISDAKNGLLDAEAYRIKVGRPSSSRPRPTSTTSTSSACTRPTRWTSTTCCSAA